MTLSVLLAIAAAALFALAASCQQHASRVLLAGPVRERPRGFAVTLLPVIALARDLGRSPLWLIGWVVNLLGFMAQAVALHLGSVALVQPLMVTQLLFALPLAAAWSKTQPDKRDWSAAVTICLGLALFMSVRGDATAGDPHRDRILLAGLCGAAVILILLLIARQVPPAQHAALVSIGAGLCFAFSAVFIKLTMTDLFERGVAATAVDWPGYALAASTLAGLILGQETFAAGSLAGAMAGMTITNPFASYLLGILCFDVLLPSSPSQIAGLAIGAAVVAAGVIVLAHSPTVMREVRQLPGAVAAPGSRPTRKRPIGSKPQTDGEG